MPVFSTILCQLSVIDIRGHWRKAVARIFFGGFQSFSQTFYWRSLLKLWDEQSENAKAKTKTPTTTYLTRSEIDVCYTIEIERWVFISTPKLELLKFTWIFIFKYSSACLSISLRVDYVLWDLVLLAKSLRLDCRALIPL